MVNAHIALDMQQQIFQMGQKKPRLSNREIAQNLGVGETSVRKYRSVKPRAGEVSLEAVRRLLKKGPLGLKDIASALNCNVQAVSRVVNESSAQGGMFLNTVDGRIDLGSSILLEANRHEIKMPRPGELVKFGYITDNHLCNKHSRLDVLNAAYTRFEREGITNVWNTGNWVDGEAKFNKTELVTAPGMDNQLDYMIDKYPVKPGITTHYIAGDDHEGWYQQREGVEIGKYLQLRAEKQGRHDLRYLGYGEADVALRGKNGEAVMRLVHPGGGSAYAISYTAQKLVESYQGGEKPRVLLMGHYHKFEYGYPREVHAVQGGCTTDQSLFMRKRRIQAMVGFCIISLSQRGDGSVDRFVVEWFPFYDRAYYEKRY
jgi:hypothetical protein